MQIARTASGKKTLKMSKSEWTNIGKKAGWMKQALNVAQNMFVNLVGEYDPLKVRQAEDILKSKLIDGKKYNLNISGGKPNYTWSSKQSVFLGGNHFIPIDLATLYYALINDGVSKEEIISDLSVLR